MTDKPLMARATAVWLVDNTTLNFKQIGDFCGMHELEVQGIADGEVAQGVKGFDPIANNQLTAEEIKLAEADPMRRLKLKFNAAAVGEEKRRGPRYTPLSKRQDRPNAIYWLVKNHPELKDAAISRLGHCGRLPSGSHLVSGPRHFSLSSFWLWASHRSACRAPRRGS